MATAVWRAARTSRQALASSSRCMLSPSVARRSYAVESSTSATPAVDIAEPFAAQINQANDNVDSPAIEDPTPSGDQLHVKLQYLLPSNKPPPGLIRAGDTKSGRVRPDKVYVPLSEHVFGMEPRRDLLHAAVVYYLDGIRKGTASTKTRSEVAFSGAKIRPQKGSGQARLGTRSNPLLRKGGVIFGPRPRDMSTKLNRRVRELALRSALSAKWKQGQLFVVKDLDWVPPPNSTSYLSKLLRSKQWGDALFLTAPRHPQGSISTSSKPNPKPSASDPIYTEQQQLEHAKAIRWFEVGVRNIPRTEVIRLDELARNAVDSKGQPVRPEKPAELHAYSILKRKMLICDVGAIEWLEEKLGGAIFHGEDMTSLATDLHAMGTEETEETYEEFEEGDLEEADALVREVGTSKARSQAA
jgi:large subunit ribosomal protein L4